jgi:hypothetical protein
MLGLGGIGFVEVNVWATPHDLVIWTLKHRRLERKIQIQAWVGG